MKAEDIQLLSTRQKTFYAAVATFIALFVIYKNFSGGGADNSKQQPLILAGSHVSTNKGYAGCRHVEDTEKFTALLAAGDTTAALNFVEQADCQLLPEGTRGDVEDQSAWHASICIRQEGHPFCSWVPTMVADKVD